MTEPSNLMTVLDEINNLELDQHIESTISVAEQIIQEMDNHGEIGVGIRHRRLFNQTGSTAASTHVELNSSPDQQQEDNGVRNVVSVSLENDSETTNSDNCENENNENSNMSRIVTAVEGTTDTTIPPTKIAVSEENLIENGLNDVLDLMRIKLKFLNDDLKLVSGRPNEAIGDFKKSVDFIPKCHFLFGKN